MNEQDKKEQRITLAEAFRRVEALINAHDESLRFPDEVSLNATVTFYEEGKEPTPPPPPKPASVQRISGKSIAIAQLRESFLHFRLQTGVKPRSLLNPWGAPPYTDMGADDFTYDIAYEEYEQWAAPYTQSTTTWRNTVREAFNQQLPVPLLPDAPATDSDQGGDSRPWQEIAREEATKACLLARQTGGWRLTKESAAEAVAKVFKERGIEGPRGELAASTIYREALQGDLWKIPKA